MKALQITSKALSVSTLLAAVAMASLCSASPAAASFELATQWGQKAADLPYDPNYGLDDTEDMSVDTSGRVYVLTDGGHTVKRYNKSGKYLGQWDVQGGLATTLTVDASGGAVYLAGGDTKVLKYSPKEGTLLGSFPLNGQFDGVVFDMELDAQGNLYVSNNSRVSKFSPNGELLAQVLITEFGQGPGKFGSGPGAIAVSPKGSVYVADLANGRINKYTPNLAYVGLLGGQKAAPQSKDPCAPKKVGYFKAWSLDVDEDGDLYAGFSTAWGVGGGYKLKPSGEVDALLPKEQIDEIEVSDGNELVHLWSKWAAKVSLFHQTDGLGPLTKKLAKCTKNIAAPSDKLQPQPQEKAPKAP